jgi:hypothetical protein
VFEGNRFSGSLPASWGAMRALQVLDVRGMCGVCGSVPFKQSEWTGGRPAGGPHMCSHMCSRCGVGSTQRRRAAMPPACCWWCPRLTPAASLAPALCPPSQWCAWACRAPRWAGRAGGVTAAGCRSASWARRSSSQASTAPGWCMRLHIFMHVAARASLSPTCPACMPHTRHAAAPHHPRIPPCRPRSNPADAGDAVHVAPHLAVPTARRRRAAQRVWPGTSRHDAPPAPPASP